MGILRRSRLARMGVAAILCCALALVSATTTLVLLALCCATAAGAAAWWLALRTLGARGVRGRPRLWPWALAAAWTLLPATLPSKPGPPATLWVFAVVAVTGLWLTAVGRLDSAASA